MEDIIERFEEEYGTLVVDARNTGSTSWGAEGPNSDTDIQCIFVHQNPAKYNYITEIETAYDHPFEGQDRFGDKELCAWDVGNFAEMLFNSNPDAIDYLYSDVVQAERLPESITTLREHIAESFNPIQLYHGLRGLSKDNYRKYLSNHIHDNNKNIYPVQGEDEESWTVLERESGETFVVAKDEPGYRKTQWIPSVKKNLIVWRGVLRGRFILESYNEYGEHRIPEPHLPTFLEEQAPVVASDEELELVSELLERKRSGEGDEHIGDTVGYETAQLPVDIDPNVYARKSIDSKVLNQFVDDAFSLVRG